MRNTRMRKQRSDIKITLTKDSALKKSSDKPNCYHHKSNCYHHKSWTHKG